MFNKWILGGVAFLIVFSVACVLWYQHGTAPYRQDAAKSEQLLWQSEIAQKVSDTDSETKQAAEAPVESTTSTTEKPIITETTGAVLETDEAAVTQRNTKTLVSPHGFGPFPSIPKGYLYLKNWKKYTVAGEGPEFELMARVRIKLWKQGIRTQGIVTRGPLMFPITGGTVYYSETQGILSHPEDNLGPFDLEWDCLLQ
jgi:hypothetical protein